MCEVCFVLQQPTAVLVRGSTTGAGKPGRDVDRYEQQPHSRANPQRSANDFHTENFTGASLWISVTAITQASPHLLGTLSTPATSLASGLGTMSPMIRWPHPWRRCGSGNPSVGLRIGVLAAGERWHDGSLRPVYEDLVGAGAVIAAAGAAERSPEAAAAVAVYVYAAADLSKRLSDCMSGRELRSEGYGTDIAWAAEVDASRSVPSLLEGRYVGSGSP